MEQWREFIDRNPLKVWRIKNGVTYRIVASHLDVAISTIQNWEQGVTKPDTLGFIALARMMKEENIEKIWEEWQLTKPLTIS